MIMWNILRPRLGNSLENRAPRQRMLLRSRSSWRNFATARWIYLDRKAMLEAFPADEINNTLGGL